MIKYLLPLIAGILICNSADIYCRITFENWVNAHAPRTIAMPVTAGFCLAEFIAKPIDKLANNEVTCGLLEN